MNNAVVTGGAAAVFFIVTAVAVFWAAPDAANLLTLAATFLLAAALSGLTAYDLSAQRLPDWMTLPLLAAGLAITWLLDEHLLVLHTIGAAAGYLVLAAVALCYRYLRGEVGLGGGDMKLLAAGGAWIGIQGLPSVLLIASASALTAVLACRVVGYRTTATTRIAFGPFLATGIWLVWLVQRSA